MIEIMQSATGLTLTIGPFVAQSDGKTPVEGVDLTTADSAIIFKHSAASASFSIDSATWTNMGSGYYSLAATSSMFDTLGPARIAINDVSIILPYHLDVMVVHDNYWNAKYSTSPFMASASGGTIASVSNSVNFTVGTIASVSNAVSLAAGQTIASVSNSVNFTTGTIASVSNSVWWTAIRDVGTVTGSVASVSAIGVQTIASVSGSVYGMGTAIMGKTSYLPSITIGSWSISACASVSMVGLVSSVSASVVDGFFEEVVEGTTTFRQSQMYQNAFAAGKAAVAVGSATVSFRDIADTKNRLVFDVDEDGNRSTVTRDGT